ncbi:MAG: hypothetical protein ACYTGW_13225 [Planctomycetota bacterium]|jgi:hypothetical protein
MGKIVKYEFLGNRWVVFFLCIIVIGIPLAVIYLFQTLVRVEEEMENPSEFMQQYRESYRARKQSA